MGTKPPFHVPVGTLIAGRYRVVEKLGEGGMGVVLAAVHEPLGTRVAIKVLGPALASDGAFAARFLREAKAAAALRSEFVVPVTDFGEDAVGPFMVMEHLDGEDLGRLLDRAGILGREAAVDAVVQAAAGLEAAHRAGIVHRDLKPSNLFRTLRPDGSHLTRVLDFGISRQVTMDEVTNITATGQVLGTPMYMSPEQIRTPRAIDARSDVWSLGAVLFEVLVGEAPFVEESMGPLMAAILENPAPDVRLRRPDIPADLAAVIARCLAKNRADRPASMAELAALLAPFGSDEARIAARRSTRGGASLAPGSIAPGSIAPGSITPGSIAPRRVDRTSQATVVLTPAATSVTPARVPSLHPPPPHDLTASRATRSRRWGLLALGIASTGLAIGATAMVVSSRGDDAPLAPQPAEASATHDAERASSPPVTPVAPTSADAPALAPAATHVASASHGPMPRPMVSSRAGLASGSAPAASASTAAPAPTSKPNAEPSLF